MTVKIGTGSGAVDPSVLHLGGAEVQKIMVGTGTSAIEAWTAYVPLAASGSKGSQQLINTSSWQEIFRWTVPQTTRKDPYIYFSLVWNAHSNAHKVQISKNGSPLATSPDASDMGDATTQTLGILEPLAQGDVLTFEAWTTNIFTANNLVSSANWSVMEDA